MVQAAARTERASPAVFEDFAKFIVVWYPSDGGIVDAGVRTVDENALKQVLDMAGATLILVDPNHRVKMRPQPLKPTEKPKMPPGPAVNTKATVRVPRPNQGPLKHALRDLGVKVF